LSGPAGRELGAGSRQLSFGGSAAGVDVHTGAFTRAHFERLVDEAVRATRASKAPLSLVWIDVDELTEANDAHGREAVDAALAELAERLAAVLDGKGPIGRVQGGAFAALLPGLSADAAVAVAERVRSEQSRGDGALRLCVSCGVAALVDGEPFGNLLEAAESACTRAKQSGRDAVAKR
jgi:diguanylate cyclase (GGDEF)-like protein